MAKKLNRKKSWMFVLLLMIIGVLYLKLSSPPLQPLPLPYNVEKNGAAAILDFTTSGNKIHTAVDDVLKKNDVVVRDRK